MLTLAEQGLWSLLVAMAGASSEPGQLKVCDGVPYTPETLALALGLRPEDARMVKPALDKFAQLRMIQIADDGTIELINFLRRQYDYPSDYPQAARARKQKQREVARTGSNIKGSDGHEDVTSVSRESHEDVRGNNRPDNRPDTEQMHVHATRARAHEDNQDEPVFAIAAQMLEQALGRPLNTALEADWLTNVLDEWPSEIVIEAIKRMMLRGGRHVRFADKLLADWRKAECRSLADVIAYEEQRDETRKARAPTRKPRAFASIEAYVNGEVCNE
ncbi:MAG: phage replisome organizer N-terminal domain-containing protein [Bacillota bacterium]